MNDEDSSVLDDSSSQELKYQLFLKDVAKKDYAIFYFEGGFLEYNWEAYCVIDITINYNRLRLDLSLGDHREFRKNFPKLEMVHNHIKKFLQTIEGGMIYK